MADSTRSLHISLPTRNTEEFNAFLVNIADEIIISLEDVSYLVWLLRNVGRAGLAALIEEQGKILVKTRV